MNLKKIIVYEDDYLLVLDKPPGVLVHPTTKEQGNTLYDLVQEYLHPVTKKSVHPVTRLDRYTSGLVIFAKESIVQAWLTKKGFGKEYLAVTEGMPPYWEGLIDEPIARAEGSIISRCIDPKGKPSRTRYRILQPGKHSLLWLQLETGRTHQIRVHLAHEGCPIVGDGLYGTPGSQGRHLLHAWRLHFWHPVGDYPLTITSKIPDDILSGLCYN